MTPWPSSDTFLRACKPTEGQGWTHVLCAVFTPEITFTDTSRLRLVEGLNTVARHKWSAVSVCYCSPRLPKIYYQNRNVFFVVKLRELRFVVVIATKSFTLHVLGNKDTSLVLRSNPSALPFVF